MTSYHCFFETVFLFLKENFIAQGGHMRKKTFITLISLVLFCFILSCDMDLEIFRHIPSVQIYPIIYNFGQVGIGSTPFVEFQVINPTKQDITLSSINFNTAEFNEITNAQGKLMTKNSGLLISVQFTPCFPIGKKIDKMSIKWVNSKGKVGIMSVDLEGEAIPAPKINASSSYDFGFVTLGHSATHDFIIENTETSILVITLFNINGYATQYNIISGGLTPITILPGAKHTFTLQYRPTFKGSSPTILEIYHNGINTPSPVCIYITSAGV